MIAIGLCNGKVMTIEDGGLIDLKHVTPDVLAFGLAHVTRFGGMGGAFSVGEHSVRMWDWARHERQDKAILRAILLHDAAECLGEGDCQRFVKRAYPSDGLRKFSEAVRDGLWHKYRPREWDWDAVETTVKTYDVNIGSLEARAFGFPHDPIPEWLYAPTVAVPLPDALWSAERTEGEYLQRWRECE